MAVMGFSTGALAKGDVSKGIEIVSRLSLKAIELSALRVHELDALEQAADSVDMTQFAYISMHAPTDYTPEQEAEVAARLHVLAVQHDWPVVIHPDCVTDHAAWKTFGELLCIENMDKRKAIGRTADELRPWFEEFQEASLCFDIAHAQQVDPSMTEAYRILREFGSRICQLHVSEVTSSSKHDRLSEGAIRAFVEVAEQLPLDVPSILETPVDEEYARAELTQAERIFEATLKPV
ncbi:MAG TPA: hypothetical protein VGD94_03100 [Vicinamibacterales bacterium]